MTSLGKRFLAVLESLGMGYGLQRGRRLARAGQVLSISLSTSIVVAQVQGSRQAPHRARVGIKAFTGPEWARIEQALAGQAMFAAKLLAGEMPADIEDVFADLGLKLFPDTMRELSIDCTCPEWEVPCEHAAAVCHVLAESFDADPFEVFAWRGRGRQALLDRMRDLRVITDDAVSEEDGLPLGRCLDSFWSRPNPPMAALPAPMRTTVADAVLDELDPLPVSLRGHEVVDLLRPAYALMTRTQPAREQS